VDGAAAVDAKNAPTAAWKTHRTRFPHRPPPYCVFKKGNEERSRLRASSNSDDTLATYRVAGFETFLTGRI
jgi:hypothetical protein